jgi:hypothetical protein
MLQGWNKKWDEWVEETGLTKFNKELAKMEFTQEGEGHPNGAAAAGGEGSGRPCGDLGSSRKADKTRKPPTHASSAASANSKVGTPASDPDALYEHTAARERLGTPARCHVIRGLDHARRNLPSVYFQVRVQLPALLKQKLLDDWERVEKGSIVPLPRRPSINDIMQQYVDAGKTNKDLVEPEEEVLSPLFTIDKDCQGTKLRGLVADLLLHPLVDSHQYALLSSCS